MRLGFEPIDNDHERVLALVAEVETSIAAGATVETLQEAFSRLSDATIAHFCAEEHWMEISGYPGLAVHRREHDEVTAWLKHLQKSLKNEATGPVSELAATETIAFFRAWVTEHLQQLDAPAVRYIARAQQDHLKAGGCGSYETRLLSRGVNCHPTLAPGNNA